MVVKVQPAGIKAPGARAFWSRADSLGVRRAAVRGRLEGVAVGRKLATTVLLAMASVMRMRWTCERSIVTVCPAFPEAAADTVKARLDGLMVPPKAESTPLLVIVNARLWNSTTGV